MPDYRVAYNSFLEVSPTFYSLNTVRVLGFLEQTLGLNNFFTNYKEPLVSCYLFKHVSISLYTLLILYRHFSRIV
jgi:hypothetical protein